MKRLVSILYVNMYVYCICRVVYTYDIIFCADVESTPFIRLDGDMRVITIITNFCYKYVRLSEAAMSGFKSDTEEHIPVCIEEISIFL